jgi:undecaprenyl pyrophosphate phosphatase UppP
LPPRSAGRRASPDRRRLFSTFVKSVLYSPAVFAPFVVGGIVMLVVERVRPRRRLLAPIGRSRTGVGLCQMLAIIPGVCSGATIVGACGG